MKKSVTGILLMIMLLSSLVIPAEATWVSNPSGIITGGEAAVFQNNPPAFGESPIGYIPSGATVAVNETIGDYRYVFYGTGVGGGMLQGWVDRNQVRMVSPTVPPPSPTQTFKPIPGPTLKPIPASQGVVISESMSLREDASTTAKKLATMKNGSILNILGKQGGWFYVSYQPAGKPAVTGWASGDYIVENPYYITTHAATYAYSIPDRSGKKVGQIAANTPLLVICEYGDFYVVNLRNASAFVYKRDIY